MAYDHKSQQKNTSEANTMPTDVSERPLDPTQNSRDFLGGDTQGYTGITQGSSQETSAEPEDRTQDTSFMRGGNIQQPATNTPAGYQKISVSGEEYQREAFEGMTQTREAVGEDVASEDELPYREVKIDVDPDGYSDELQMEGNENTLDAEEGIVSSEAPYTHPENLGQQDPVGGTEAAPTGEDVGQMASRYGLDLDVDDDGEGYENDELNTAEKIDEAERRIQQH